MLVLVGLVDREGLHSKDEVIELKLAESVEVETWEYPKEADGVTSKELVKIWSKERVWLELSSISFVTGIFPWEFES